MLSRDPFNLSTENINVLRQVMTVRAYLSLLKKHDWTYDYSDDPDVWRRGTAEREFLTSFHSDPLYKEMYNDYQKFVFHFGEKEEPKEEWY
jgi:6-phosphogluconate dehydrogenase (decarboxylating)